MADKSYTISPRSLPAGPGSQILGRKVPGKFVQADVILSPSAADQQNTSLQIDLQLDFSPDGGTTWVPQGSCRYHAGSLIPQGVPMPGLYNVDLFGDAGQDARISWNCTVAVQSAGLQINLRETAQ
jgi:hypothetical protein